MMLLRSFIIVITAFFLASSLTAGYTPYAFAEDEEGNDTKDLEELGDLRVFKELVGDSLKNIERIKFDPDTLRLKADRLIERSLGIEVSVTGDIISADSDEEDKAIEDEIAKAEAVKSKAYLSIYQLGDSQFDNQFIESNFDLRLLRVQNQAAVNQGPANLSGGNIKIPDARTIDEKKEDERVSKLNDIEIIELAIEYYQEILEEYPNYEKNDYVLYQLARGYSDIGQAEKSIELLGILIEGYPTSRYAAEAHFRRAEYYAIRGDLDESDRNYVSVLNYGPYSDFYEYALYKRGWAKFRQGLHDDALNSFTELLDIRMLSKYDYDELAKLNASENADPNIQKLQDTLRAISLSFSYLQGVNDINRYFKRIGRRKYENLIYDALANYYIDKQRYTEAAEVYTRFIAIYPYHTLAPDYYLKISKIYDLAGFTNLEIDLRKGFARSYDLRSEYWTYFDVNKNKGIVETVSKNLVDLASFYHARFQTEQKKKKDSTESFKEAKEWYQRYLASFPNSKDASKISYYLGELYYSNNDMVRAQVAYEDSAYVYPKGDKSPDAAYASVVVSANFAEQANTKEEKDRATEALLASSLKFSHSYPNHPESKDIQLRTASLLFESKKFVQAVAEAKFLLTKFANLTKSDKFSAWRIIAYSLYDGDDPKTAEVALTEALRYAPKKTRAQRQEIENLTENLAASIFKQGEKLFKAKKYEEAILEYKRVAIRAPKSKNRQNADYDIASIYIVTKQWKNAIGSLTDFRKRYRKSQFLPDITKKLAVSYKEDVQFGKAAVEFERIIKEDKDKEIKKAALVEAGKMFTALGDTKNTIRIYNRYIAMFPKPLDNKLAILDKIAKEYKKANNKKARLKIVKRIYREGSKAKKEDVTDRVIYYTAISDLELKQPIFNSYARIKLKIPLKRSLKKKKTALQKVLKTYSTLNQYKIANITSAATYYIGISYLELSKAFLESQRPRKLKGLDLIQYNIIIEEQAEPFEEKGIAYLEKNLQLLDIGLYDEWIQKTIDRLGELFPARFAKKERKEEISEDIL